MFEIIEDKNNRIKLMFSELSLFNDLKESKGALLDILGNNYKVSRLGKTDEEYRKIIGFIISSTQFLGNIEEIKNILSTYFDEGLEQFSITEFSGKVKILIPDTLSKEEVIKLLKNIKSAGVGLNVDFEIYIEDYLLSELEEITIQNIAEIKIARR